MMSLRLKMFAWMLFLGSVLSAPTDEFREFINEGDLSLKDDNLLMRIVPSGYSSQKFKKEHDNPLSEIFDIENEHYKTFIDYVKKGVTLKDLTFNIYDDEMRGAATALFRLLQHAKGIDHVILKEWALFNVNKDMWRYAINLQYLYTDKDNEKNSIIPPFIAKPNFFVNSETISKALRLNEIMTSGNVNIQQSAVNQYYKTDYNINKYITINTNYSGWNLLKNGIDEEVNYFREDISLNSYYYGIHLLHPFWMSNEELEVKNPRHAEHYYYSHQQLMARYLLEKEHLKVNTSTNAGSENVYNPYLVHDNGLPFPIRSCIRGNWNAEKALLKSIDLGLKECISRGLIVMNNGTTINMTSYSQINLLAKLIRANLDGIKTAKVVRSVFGYGGNVFSLDQYNPAPSILHYPETSLRDPVYWYLIQYMLNYFTDFKNIMEPYDLSQHEDDNIQIVDSDFTKITTYFQTYAFDINKSSGESNNISPRWPVNIASKQKRLQHFPFTLNFTVESKYNNDAIVRLFLGPECSSDCWMNYQKFFEIDSFNYLLEEGINIISWSSESSNRYSFDNYFNLEQPSKENKFNLFKFPENLLIPKGLEEGLNMTLFVMITPADDFSRIDFPTSGYGEVCLEMDSKPLGFPFHRQAAGFKDLASNYRFYPICVYHKKMSDDSVGQFSAHLY